MVETSAPDASRPDRPVPEDGSSAEAAVVDEAFTLEELPPDFWDAPPAPEASVLKASAPERSAEPRARPNAPSDSPPTKPSAQPAPSARARPPASGKPPPSLSPRVAELQSLFPGRVLRVEALEPASVPEELSPETPDENGLGNDLDDSLEDADAAVQEGLFDD